MPTLSIVNFNIVCATLGGFITLFGLVSYLLKEKFYLSEALISTIAGVIFSPHATNLIRPLEFANFDEVNLETITLYFTRLVLGVQLVLAGVQLPSKYLWTEWRSLSILLGPGMCIMWMATSLLVWGLVPNIDFVMALSVGACVTPTDPVLSNSIVKGKFADKNIPPKLQKIIIAESGANDGLGYPFLFLGLYLLKYAGDGGLGEHGGVGHAFALWFYDTWAYVILLSIAYGALVGYLAKELLHWAEERHYVDRESFLVFAITLALFIVGTVGMLGSDDVLACFIAGNAFTWDDWFRLETMDDSLQPTIDMLLNVSIFIWFGAVCPWHKFAHNDVIPIYRLMPLGILVLLLRRLPMVLSFHKGIHQIESKKHASFVGFFGPIGVSAIFYLYISREFLREIVYQGGEREDAYHLGEVMDIVVWFLAVCSIVVHGLSIPLGKLGFHLPRTISTAISSERASRNVSRNVSRSPSRARSEQGISDIDRNPLDRSERSLVRSFRRRRPTTSENGPPSAPSLGVGGTFAAIFNVPVRVMRLMRGRDSSTGQKRLEESDDSNNGAGTRPDISGPQNPRIIGNPINEPPLSVPDPDLENKISRTSVTPQSPTGMSTANSRAASPGPGLVPGGFPWSRSIRFPDEQAATPKPGSTLGTE